MLEFWIERGMMEGERIVLQGEADEEPGKKTGDVIFVIAEKVHPVFRRRGPNLHATFQISLAEALCGFSRVIITTLDGRGLKYTHTVETGKVIRPGEVFKIPGEGMPLGKKSDRKGDLYLKASIDFPEDGWTTDPAQIDLLRTILSIPVEPARTNAIPEIVDDIALEKVEDDEGWETESDGESEGAPEQCTTQ